MNFQIRTRFWFLKQGYLKEMYKNPFDKEDSLFSLIPPKSILLTRSLFNDQHPKHYFIAYGDVEFVGFGLAITKPSIGKRHY